MNQHIQLVRNHSNLKQYKFCIARSKFEFIRKMFKDKKEYIVGKTLAKIVKLKAKIEKNFRKTELRMKNDGSNF